MCLAIALAIVFTAAASALADGRKADEDRLKASFVYKFALFISWPGENLEEEGDPVVFCVAARPALADALEKILEDRRVHARKTRVVRVDPGDTFAACQVLFVGASRRPELARLTRKESVHPTLTIGEGAIDGGRAAMIELVKDGRRLQFEIRVDVLEKSGLRVSSQLLRLASRVEGGP